MIWPDRSRLSDDGDDSGRIMILSLGFGMFALALILVLASITTVHLDRQELQRTADLAAVAASEALDESGYYGTEVPELVALSAATVKEETARYLGLLPAGQAFLSVSICEPTGVTPADQAEVTLCARSRPAALAWLPGDWGEGILLEVTATARSARK